MKKITLLLLLFGFVGMQAFAQPSTITITAPTDATSVRLTGPWWGWDPNAGPEATKNTDGTWLISFPSVGTVNMEYLLIVNGVQEVLWDNAANAECGTRIDAGNLITDYWSYGNRVWKASDGVDYSETFEDCSQMVFPGTNPAPSVPSLPLDFSDVSQLFTADLGGGGPVDVSIVDEKLQVIGSGADWDSVFLDITPIDLSNNAANTITLEIESTTATDGVDHFHRINVGGKELDFFTTGKELKTVVLDFPVGSPAAASQIRIFLDAGYGATKTSVETYLIDNIALFVDAEAPTAFTATVGAIGAFGAELVLNATDNSGSVTYDISYNDGANTVQTTGASGVEKSFTVSGLTPETAYSFEVSASDGAGNVATNNPVSGLDVTTIADTSNECEGFSSEASEGTFSENYSYGFETLTNGDVRLTFAMSSGTAGVVAYAWRKTPFAETPMTVSGTVATLDISGYTTGESISYAVKFAWAAGGFGVTKYFSYTVGEDCATASIDKNNLLGISLYPNPAKGKLNISAKNTIESATIYNILGKKVKSFTVNANTSSLDVSGLSRGIYILKYTANNAVGSMKFVKE